MPGDHSLGAKEPVLLIESDRGFAALLKAAFYKAHIRNPVDLATNAHEAVAYLNRFKRHSEPRSPALIILGLASQFDCSVMMRWLRRQPQLLHVPCVVFSAEPPSGKNHRMSRELVCDCYARPSDFSALISFASQLRDKWLVSAARLEQSS